MKKFIILLILIAVAGALWLLFASDRVDYVATIDDEITELETELALLDAAVANGSLTPTAAAEAQTRIITRLNAISEAGAKTEKAQLTDAQRVQLQEGLSRLTSILTTYQATLVAVDEAVATLPEAQRPQLKRGGGGRHRTITAALAETAQELEAVTEAAIDDFTPDETVDEVIAELASSTIEVIEEDAVTSTTTDTMMDTATSTDEVAPEADMDETATDTDMQSSTATATSS